MYTDIKVGFTCNNRCVHCIIEPLKTCLLDEGACIDDDTFMIKKSIDNAIDMGSMGIVLTGGEVTVRKDFEELLSYALTKGVQVSVQTNGRALHNKESIAFLKGLPPVQFVVAVHGPNAEIHDAITRRPGSHGQTIQAIANLQELGNVRVIGKVVISHYNLDCLPDICTSLHQAGVLDVVLAFPHAEEFPAHVFADVVPRYRDLDVPLSGVFDVVQDLDMRITLETIPYCVFSTRPEYWCKSQDIRYCVEQSKYEAFIRTPGDDNLKQWSLFRTSSKTRSIRCTECLLDRICEGPWSEYVEHYGDTELQPITDPDVVKHLTTD